MKNKLNKITNLVKEKKQLFENKNLRLMTTFFLIFLIGFLAFSLRNGSINLEGAQNIAERSTLSNFEHQIRNDINTKYPDLNEIYREEILQKEILKLQKDKVYELSSGQILDLELQTNILKENIIDNFKFENGQTYLLAIDPYFFYKISSLKNKEGKFYTNEKDGKLYLDYRQSPIGKEVSGTAEFHTFLISKIFKLNGLNEDSKIEEEIKLMFNLSLIFSVLSTIIFFIFMLRLTNNQIISFFSALLLTSIPIFVSRTVAGFSDTDSYVVLFPILIILLLYESFKVKNLYLKILFSFLSSIFILIFYFAWESGVFFLTFIIISFMLVFTYKKLFLFIKNLEENNFRKINFKKLLKSYFKKENKNSIYNETIVFLSFIISLLMMGYFFKINILSDAFWQIIGSFSGFAGAVASNTIWANVGSSVAELNKTNFSNVMNSAGGKIIFFISLFGLLFLNLNTKINNQNLKINLKKINLNLDLNIKKIRNIVCVLFIIYYIILVTFSNLINVFSQNSTLIFIIILGLPIMICQIFNFLVLLIEKEKDKVKNAFSIEKIFISFILTLWILGAIYLSINGIRFILILATPISILFGIGIFYMSKLITNFFKLKEFEVKNDFFLKGFFSIVVVSILSIFLIAPIFYSSSSLDKQFPNFDDEWFSLMKKIENESNENAIITSWWDFGHYFAAMSNRGVTFDGGSQVGSTANLVGKLLLEDEKVSKEILKMLICSHSETAYNYMNNIVKDKSNGINLIQDILFETFKYQKIEDKKRIIKNYKYYNFSEEEINEIVNLIACDNPRENYLILSQDMVGKSGVWSHWGSWDYDKKYVFNNKDTLTKKEISQNLKINESVIEKYLNELDDIDRKVRYQNLNRDDLINRWFAPYYGYASDLNSFCFENPQNQLKVTCQNGIEINLDENSVHLPNVNLEFGVENVYMYYPDDNVNIIKLNTSSSNKLDLTLFKNNNGIYNLYVSFSPLGNSLFTKGFFLEGKTLSKNFEVFDVRRNIMGQKIVTLKTKFEN